MTSTNQTEYKVVGSSCLKDFLGHGNPEAIVSLFQTISSAVSAAEDASGFGDSIPDRWDLLTYLGWVTAEIRVNGWLSRTQAGLTGAPATANTAYGAMEMMAIDPNKVKKESRPTAEDFAQAEGHLNYIKVFIDRMLEEGTLTDYLHNINVLGRMNSVNFKTAGITAAIIATSMREQGREIERRKFSNLKLTSTYQGEVKKRSNWKLTVVNVRSLQSQYGASTMVKFSDGNNAFTWFGSGDLTPDWEIGKEYTFKATVKGHEEYQGLKQTLLTRVSVP